MVARIEDCPLAAAVELVGDWWTLELLHDAFDGLTHPDEFQRSLQTPPDLLVARLEALVETGLMERQGGAGEIRYGLTALGRSVRPVLLTLAAWTNSRLDPIHRSLVLVDAATGCEVEPILVDRESGRRVDTPEFRFTAGPNAGPAMRARYAASAS